MSTKSRAQIEEELSRVSARMEHLAGEIEELDAKIEEGAEELRTTLRHGDAGDYANESGSGSGPSRFGRLARQVAQMREEREELVALRETVEKQEADLRRQLEEAEASGDISEPAAEEEPLEEEPEPEEEPEEPDEEEEAEPPEAAACILVVDDVRVARLTISRVLGKAGFEVLEADSATEALAVLQTHRVDLVILDIMMPDVDGLALLRHIRERSMVSDLPILMCSASQAKDHVVEAGKLGVVGFLIKPVDPRELRERVARVLESRPDIAADAETGTTEEDAP